MPDTHVADGGRRLDGGVPHGKADGLGHERRRGLLDHLLMAPLHRALAIEEVQHGAAAVADHLHLDVPRRGQVALQEDLVRAEGRSGLALGPRHRLGQVLRPLDQAHAAPAAAGRGLHEERETDGGRGGGQVARRRGRRRARQHGYSGCRHHVLGPRLVAHHPHGLDRRPDPDDARVPTGLGQGRDSRTGTRNPGARRRCPKPRPLPPAPPRSGTSRSAPSPAAAPRRRPQPRGGSSPRPVCRRQPLRLRRRARPG